MTQRQGERQTVKRRGILAAAGAVVAGIAAKQASLPVAAATGGTQGTALIIGANSFTGTANTETDTTYLTNGTVTIGTFYSANTFLAASQNGSGVLGYAFSSSPAVSGINSGGGGAGVVGVSDAGHGVIGQATGPPGQGYVGVYGYGNGSGTAGVLGDCSPGGATTTGNAGVQGLSAQYGVIGSVNNAPNTIGVWASNTSTGAAPIGVRGDCTNGIGIYGSTSAAGQYGVIGQTLVDNAFGLAGIANTNGSAAFAGGTLNPSSFAASFQGHVQVFGGAFDVAGLGNKHGITQHPDGSWRTFYSVESPECWVEDFGTGTLAAGIANITLDKDFAALIHTEEYHVFLTEHDQHNALHVTGRTGAGFVVQADEATLKAKGKAAASVTGTFSWRVVAKPKTAAKVERLAKARLAPKIDMTTLPGGAPPPLALATPPKPPTPPTGPASAPLPRGSTNPVVQPASSAPSPAPPASIQPPATNPPSTGNAPNPLPAPRP